MKSMKKAGSDRQTSAPALNHEDIKVGRGVIPLSFREQSMFYYYRRLEIVPGAFFRIENKQTGRRGMSGACVHRGGTG